jgi:glutamyl-tRNA(Gln) amidotransferase subunit E
LRTLLKPFEEMTDADYAALGLKVGLEIHQQLLTEKKLFCRCRAGRYAPKYDAQILRHMRPTLSELGEYDGTALMEFKTKKDIIYRINHETLCTYEMDDTPPFEINPQALDIALEIAMLLNYNLVGEIHIARKQYLDGSIPTGFQRTTIVGVDGWILFRGRNIGLIQMGLEEDACREVSDVGHERVYLTDRLGMPLVETVTHPELRTPQEAAEAADLLRRLARSTGKVRTGIGAGRQDVNVSITGGTRIEIKGVHRIPLIPLLVYNEALRQVSLLRIRAELHKRGITEKTFESRSADVTRLLGRTAWDPIRQALDRGEEVHCVNLKGYVGMLSQPTQTGKVFSREISDRVRVIACLTRLPNILTSESTEETIDSFAGRRIRKAVQADSQDGLILVWGNPVDVRTAVQEIVIRAREAAVGIPSETRQALADGTNGFERILPGPNRMYPDTDLPPIEITNEKINRLKVLVPRPLWEREKKIRAMGTPEHLVLPVAASPSAGFFEFLAAETGIPPVRIARLLFEKIKEWKRSGLPVQKLTEPVWKAFFMEASKNALLLENAAAELKAFMRTDSDDWEYCAPVPVDEKEAARIVEKIIRNKIPSSADPKARHRFIMGRVMENLRGKISGETVSRVVKEMIGRLED